MKLFRRKQRPISPRAAEMAERWAAAILSRQRRIADWLYRKTAYWDKRSKLIALFLFCLVFGSLSLWLFMQAFI